MPTINESLRNQFNRDLQFAFPQTDTDPAALHASAGPVASIPVYGKVANVHGLGRLVKRYPKYSERNAFYLADAPDAMCVRNDEDWTIAAVVKPRGGETNYGIYGSGLNFGSYFALYAGDPDLKARWYCGTNPEATVLSCPGLTKDDWSLVVCSYEAATKKLSLSINDGAPVSVVLVDPSQPVGKMAIGADTVDSVLRFQGDMSYVAKWGRILTAGERAAMYDNGSFPSI